MLSIHEVLVLHYLFDFLITLVTWLQKAFASQGRYPLLRYALFDLFPDQCRPTVLEGDWLGRGEGVGGQTVIVVAIGLVEPCQVH